MTMPCLRTNQVRAHDIIKDQWQSIISHTNMLITIPNHSIIIIHIASCNNSTPQVLTPNVPVSYQRSRHIADIPMNDIPTFTPIQDDVVPHVTKFQKLTTLDTTRLHPCSRFLHYTCCRTRCRPPAVESLSNSCSRTLAVESLSSNRL